MSGRFFITGILWTALGAAIIGASRYHFLLFHGIAEFFSIGIGLGVFILAINNTASRQDSLLTIVGIGLFFVSAVDMLHTLAYKGMGVFPGNDANLASQLWIAGRYIMAVSFLAAALCIRREVRKRTVFSLFIPFTALLLLLIFTGHFPAAFSAERGMTLFKIGSEYLVCAVFALAAVLIHRRGDRLKPKVLRSMLLALVFGILAEIAFTMYTDVFAISNALGHLFKMLSFYCIYKALVETTIISPQQTLSSLIQDRDKHLEEQVRERTAELEAIFNNALVGLMQLYGGRVLLRGNQRLADIFGYDSPQEMIGLNMRSLHVDEEHYNEFGQIYYNHLRDRDYLHVEYELRRKDGSPVWCSLSGSALDHSRPADLDRGVLWVVDDISHRKEAESRLMQGELWMRTMFNSLEEAVFLATPDRRLTDINTAAEQIFGYTLEQLQDSSTEVLHVDRAHFQEFGTLIQEAFARGEAAQFNFQLKRRNGEIFPSEHFVSLLHNEDGSPLGILSVVRDISARTSAEQAIRDSEARFRTLFNVAAIPLCFVRNDGRILDLNNRFTDLFGYTHEDIPTLDHWWTRAYPDPLYREWVIQTWQEAVDKSHGLPSRQIRSEEYTVTCKDGSERQVHISGTTIEDHFLATFVDMTELKRADDQLAEKARQLEMANQELNQYAFVVSHDLKAPLRAIHNYATFLREDLDPELLDQDLLVYLNGLGTAVEQCQELVDDLLELSRIGRNNAVLEEVDIRILVSDMATRMSIPSDVRLEMPDTGLVCLSNPVLLRQIIANLLSNAMKFNNRTEKLVRLDWQEHGESWSLSVEDNGIGIDEKYQERIFHVFQRLHTRSEYEGTGIGLAMVKKAASFLGGTVELRSEPGRGSVFSVTLPRTVPNDLTGKGGT